LYWHFVYNLKLLLHFKLVLSSPEEELNRKALKLIIEKSIAAHAEATSNDKAKPSKKLSADSKEFTPTNALLGMRIHELNDDDNLCLHCTII
jgi:hypothetical protein